MTTLPGPELRLEIKLRKPDRFPEALQRTFGGCRVIWGITEKCLRGESLTGAERHVLIYVLANLAEDGRVALHQILNQAPEYDPSLVNKEIHAVPPNPMGCCKVRKNLPEFEGSEICNCQFRIPEGAYPSPVVHGGIIPGNGKGFPRSMTVKPAPVALSRLEEYAGSSGQLDQMMREYQSLLSESARIKGRLHLLISGHILWHAFIRIFRLKHKKASWYNTRSPLRN